MRKRASNVIRQTLTRYHGEQEAATATEYAVMLAMIILVAFGAIQAYGTSLNGMYGDIQATLFVSGS